MCAAQITSSLWQTGIVALGTVTDCYDSFLKHPVEPSLVLPRSIWCPELHREVTKFLGRMYSERLQQTDSVFQDLKVFMLLEPAFQSLG